MLLETFVLVGTILSHDAVFSTVSFELNPSLNGGPSIAVMTNSSIPCEVSVGKKIYVVKDKDMEVPTVVCKLEENKE